jgi:hypothetical protein
MEAVFVGLYTQLLYLLLSSVVNDQWKWFLFFLGFLKHLSGDVLGIHTYYCNNGAACFGKEKRISVRTNLMILIECIGEGILFYILGLGLYKLSDFFIKKKWTTIFLIGFLLHVSFELLGFHGLFCKYRCKAVL